MISFVVLTKSSGPYQISTRMLRATATSITPAVTKQFDISICKLENWKHVLVIYLAIVFQKVVTSLILITTGLFPCILTSKLLEKHINLQLHNETHRRAISDTNI